MASSRAEDTPNRLAAPERELPRLLNIRWRRGTNLPQGFQDSDGGIIDGRLITVAGFCSGGLEEDNRRKPGKYPRGFLKKSWALDLHRPDQDWRQLPDFPGVARQGLSAAKVGDKLYLWGGFSYEKPYCYADGWRLSRQGSHWTWEPLPLLPGPTSSVAMATLGSKIYACGGADYNAEKFFTDTDRHGGRARLGAQLHVIDTADLKAGWSELPPCPGTPRWVHTMAAIDGSLFVIGGATGDYKREGKNYGYCTVVDNWRYDVANHRWKRLRDLPIASGNFPRSANCVFKNRYVILPGGYQYSYVRNPDGTVRAPYGKVHSANSKSGLCNDVFLYDAAQDQFGRADPLPIDNNLPMTIVRGDSIYLLGGETGGGFVEGEYYGHHPDLLLVGKIEELPRGQ